MKPVMKRESENTKRNREIVEVRRILHRAYFAIRKDPDQKQLADTFARALGGRGQITVELIARANHIIGTELPSEER